MIAIIDGDVLVYQSMWGCDTLEEAKLKFVEVLQMNLEALFTTDYVMALGGPDNFRETLYVDYKKSNSRLKSSSNKPSWFNELKSFASEFEGAVVTDNCEADDLVRIWATECSVAGIDHCVVSIDKDLDCIPGKHYNPRKQELYTITEEEADAHYWKQVLMGDSVDNIPGIFKMGPKGAEKVLSSASDHRSRRDAVCRAYHNAYGDNGYENLITNGRLIHIWRHVNDHFKIKREVYESAISL